MTKKSEHKHLGLFLDEKLTFAHHISDKINKAKKLIGPLKYLRSYLPMRTLIQIYKSFIRPHLDYGDIIYHIPQSTNLFDSSISLHSLMESVENIQYQAALAITGCWKGSSREKLYTELGWETLSDRRWARRLIQLYKIKNDFTPEYLKLNLPSPNDRLSRNNSGTSFYEIMCNTTKYKNSFFPDAVKSWNNIGNDFTSSTTVSCLKSKLFNLIRPQPKRIYDIHDPSGIRFLYQLRVGLSPLKCHKRHHNFLDTPVDLCDCTLAPEDTSHFFFNCTLYTPQRISLVSTVNNILNKHGLLHLSSDTNLYLYGHESLDQTENRTILLATITFIKQTKRFCS